VQPVHTRSELRAADEAAIAEVGLEALVGRAGYAVANAAIALLGTAYGKRVIVVAGSGHNGDDGRVASRILRRRGARVRVVAPPPDGGALAPCDLVIDAAYGTGFRGEYRAPEPPSGVPVLAVDIASGLDSDTGEAAEGAVRATSTVTMAALKPGLLLGDGPALSGAVTVASIGIAVAPSLLYLVDDDDLDPGLPERARSGHKWQTACALVAGSPGMLGAAHLTASGAMRAGAGMVRWCVPGASPDALPSTEAVARAIPAEGFADDVLAELQRCHALVVGPGLGTAPGVQAAVRDLIARAKVPVLVDADGLTALGSADAATEVLAGRGAPAILTPHDREFERLAGRSPGPDRVGAARELAYRLGAVVLLKGSTTVVAAPGGLALLVTAGSSRLATAGTGDVLSGVVGAFLARGLDTLLAGALGAHVHGRAASLGHREGLVAGDLPELVAQVLSGAGRTSAG